MCLPSLAVGRFFLLVVEYVLVLVGFYFCVLSCLISVFPVASLVVADSVMNYTYIFFFF